MQDLAAAAAAASGRPTHLLPGGCPPRAHPLEAPPKTPRPVPLRPGVPKAAWRRTPPTWGAPTAGVGGPGFCLNKSQKRTRTRSQPISQGARALPPHRCFQNAMGAWPGSPVDVEAWRPRPWGFFLPSGKGPKQVSSRAPTSKSGGSEHVLQRSGKPVVPADPGAPRG